MKLTDRCFELLKLFQGARWLSTGQVRRRFFPHATLSAARRRLRLLATAGYLRKHQTNRMEEAWFTLGREGKQWLERDGSVEITLERHVPKQLLHLAGINDIRIAAEMTGHLSYFFAAWELPGISWQHPIVPDAIFGLGDRAYAVEYDRGSEGLRFFVGSKIPCYRRGFPGLPLTGVIIVANTVGRMEALTRAVGDHDGQFLFTTIALVRERSILASIYRRRPGAGMESLAGTCSPDLSSRGDRQCGGSYSESVDYAEPRATS